MSRCGGSVGARLTGPRTAVRLITARYRAGNKGRSIVRHHPLPTPLINIAAVVLSLCRISVALSPCRTCLSRAPDMTSLVRSLLMTSSIHVLLLDI